MEGCEIVDSMGGSPREGSSSGDFMEEFNTGGCINGSNSRGFIEGSPGGDFIDGDGVEGANGGSESGDPVGTVLRPTFVFSTKSLSTASSISSSRPLKSSSPGILSIIHLPLYCFDCLSINITFLLTSFTTNLLISLRVSKTPVPFKALAA